MHAYGALRLTAYITVVGSSLFIIPDFILRKKKLIKTDDPLQQLLIPGDSEEMNRNRKSVSRIKRRMAEVQPISLQQFLRKFNLW